MSEPTFLSGQTIHFRNDFYNFQDQLTDPSSIKLKIMDARYEPIHEFNLDASNRLETGKYSFYFTTPVSTKTLRYYYEWNGIINATVSIERGSFVTKFV